MKKLIYILLVGVLFISSCQEKTNSTAFDPVETKAKVTAAVDSIYLAYNTRQIDLYLSFLDEEGLYCGTDAKEIWDKKTYAELMTSMFSDTIPTIKIDSRVIHLDKTGNSAIVVDQFKVEWSKNIPLRYIFHFVYVDNKWKCDFSSISFTPNNEDLKKIIEAVNVKELPLKMEKK